jgi:uncharacterized SAM-binding protein YcdF (DUF218 family)
MKKGIVFSVVLLLGGLLVAYSFWNYSVEVQFTLPKEVGQTDLIVVLAGGRGRLSESIKLLKAGHAKRLFIAGAGHMARVNSVFDASELEDIDRGQIYLERISKSTYQNALQVRNYVIEHEVSSILLITSNYHMKRAKYIFEEILPQNVSVHVHAIESENFLMIDWWKNPTSLKIAFAEYLKYLWYRVVLLRSL